MSSRRACARSNKNKPKRRTRDEEIDESTRSSKLELIGGAVLAVLLVLLEVYTHSKYLIHTFVQNIMIAVSGGGGGEKSGQVSSKKQARLANKQAKLMAEYRLVVGKDLGDESAGGGAPKKIKLDPDKGGKLGEEEFKNMKKQLAERKRLLTQLPRFTVTQGIGYCASVFQTTYATRTPLLFSDVQHLVTYAYGGNVLVPPPSRWCSLQKPNKLAQLIVLVVDGLGLNEFVDNEHVFSRSMRIFGGEDEKNKGILEFLSPHWYGASVEEEMLKWGVLGGANPNSSPDEDKRDLFHAVVSQIGSVFPIEKKTEGESPVAEPVSPPPGDTFPRTDLVLTLPQLIQEAYPLPIPANTLTRSLKHEFVPTSESYKPVNARSKMFAIDCEMCATAKDPQVLTKIAVIDEDLNTVYESLVKPRDEITDYLTRWSGITKEMLDGVEVRIEDVQAKIKEIVAAHPDSILVGQSLNCDMKAMRMTHPYVIDTSVVFNLTGVQGKKSRLRDLVYNLLDEEIQTGDKFNRHNNNQKNQQLGHCPVEDAAAAMKLVKTKLNKGFSFGNEVKNVNIHNTVVALDPAFTPISIKKNKLDKDVLVISPEAERMPEFIPVGGTAKSHPSKLRRRQSTGNKETVKLMSQNCFTSFMTVGFYKIEPDYDTVKGANKLDKRINKLFNAMGHNSMLVVACNKGGGSSSADDNGRRNNGVCFVRVKPADVAVRRDN